jgi:hypothetical protein
MSRRGAVDFLERFVRPLVAGGEVHVGPPIPPDDHARLIGELDHATVPLVAIDDVRAEVAAVLCARPPAMVFGEDELALMIGLHNALVLAHPDADGALITDRMRKKVASAALAAVSQPLARDRTRALARHGLLHQLHALGRRDLLVSWWTGKARFYGQAAPARLTAWPNLRRVREDVTRAGFDELLGSPEAAPVAAALLRRSPITAVIAAPAVGPPLHWEDATFLLRDPELARALAYAVADAPGGAVAAAARLAAAFEQLVERTPPVGDVRAVAAFLVHVAAIALVGATDDKAQPLVAALAATGNRPRGLVTFAALPAALAAIAPTLAVPPGLAAEPAWARRWELERAAVGDALGDATIAGVAERLVRHLTPAVGPGAAPGPTPGAVGQ